MQCLLFLLFQQLLTMAAAFVIRVCKHDLILLNWKLSKSEIFRMSCNHGGVHREGSRGYDHGVEVEIQYIRRKFSFWPP